MEVVKAFFIGLLAGLGVATVGHDLPGSVGDIARWRSAHFDLFGIDWHFSMAIFLGVSLFALPFILWARK